ncbi:MAG: glycosyltransferase family 39 protein, partial [Gaiellaceae bacterium]
MSAAPAEPRRRWLAAVAAVTVLAALLRFPTLDRQSFWSDEAITVLLTRMSFTDLLTTIGDTESTPPLYYVLAWIWAKVFGYGEIGLRSLSALAGTATVPVTFLAGAMLVGRRAGVAAAGLVAVSPLLVWYSQEARSYALAVLLCGISFAALAYVLERPTTRSLSFWAVASVLAIASHYFAVFVVGAELLWLLLADRRPAARIAAAFVAAGAAGMSLFALEQRGNGLVDVIAMSASLAERVQVLAKQLLVGGAALPADRAVAGFVALFVVASVVLVLTRGSARERRAFAVAASVGGAAVVVPVAFAVVGLDYVNTRNAQVGMVPLAVAASA